MPTGGALGANQPGFTQLGSTLWLDSAVSTISRMLRGRDPLLRLNNEIERHELVQRLDARWSSFLTIVRAPAGSGKTTLLAQAMRRNRLEARGRDIWIACRPSHVDASRLIEAIGQAIAAATESNPAVSEDAALPLDPPILERRPQSMLEIVDLLAAESPTVMSLILDDAHVIPEASSGGELLQRLVEEAPANVSIVIATRHDVPIATARLLSHGAVTVIDGRSDLWFTEAELDELGTNLGSTDTTLLGAFEGWPALTTLGVHMGEAIAAEFIFEELLLSLDEADRRLLEALALLGDASPSDLARLAGVDLSRAGALVNVPLVSAIDDERLRAHDLWRQAFLLHPEAPDSGAMRERLINLLLERQDFDRALIEALETSNIGLVLDVVSQAAVAYAPLFPDDTATRWLGLIPEAVHDSPEVRLLLASAGLVGHDRLGDELRELQKIFEARSADDPLLAVLGASVYHAYETGDFARVFEVQQLYEATTGPVSSFLHSARSAIRGVLADLSGDSAAALDHLREIDMADLPAEIGTQLSRLIVVNLVMLGRSADGFQLADELAARAGRVELELTTSSVRWFAGDPRRIRTITENRSKQSALDGYEHFVYAVYSVHFSAAFGNVPPRVLRNRGVDLGPLAGVPRFETMAAVADSMLVLMTEGEAQARSLFDDRMSEIDRSLPAVHLELHRFGAIPFMFDEGLAADVSPESPDHLRVAAIGNQLKQLRIGDLDPHGAGPTADHVVTALPLPWSAELVARAFAAGHGWASPLAVKLADVVGPSFRQAVVAVRDAMPAVAEAATGLLADIPVPPPQPVRLDVLGPFRLQRGATIIDDPLLRRSRVRQLLTLLVVNREMTRSAIVEALWPDVDVDKGFRNLRTNLSHVRRLLEPDLAARQASYFMRHIGDVLTLDGSSLTTDLADFSDLVEAGVQADDAGRLDEACDQYLKAVALWRGTPVPDLVGGDSHALDLSLRSRVVQAGARASEIDLARGRIDRSIESAQFAMSVDPFSDRAHRVVLAALIASGAVPAVGEAVGVLDAHVAEGTIACTDQTEMVLRRARDLIDSS